MRLAFSALEAEGFVEIREGAGTFVSAYWPKPAPFVAHDAQGTDSAPGQGTPANDCHSR
ncbi:hypothetical protein G3256_04195 [Roseobacter ponti]|uniref:Uncharacterized protein n=1 Tax=Roseobacter ponti TaxID=1891787 RepID=A0A858SNK3_9RHOB|nr:hypothetical protein G3256_04195 [Roseobacter ponti]